MEDTIEKTFLQYLFKKRDVYIIIKKMIGKISIQLCVIRTIVGPTTQKQMLMASCIANDRSAKVEC